MNTKDGLRIVVVGANAAGLKAAARAKRLLPAASVTVVDRGQYISYGACGMPYVVSGDIESVDSLRETSYGAIRDPDFFRKAKGLEVLIQTEAQQIDREGKRVLCRSLVSGETKAYPYDRLILATGARPIVPKGIPANHPRVSTFKVLEDAMALRQALQAGKIGKVGLVGAGPIGCELAEAFKSLWGAEVILFDAAPTVLPAMLDKEMARFLETYLREQGVKLHTDCPLTGIAEAKEGVVIQTPQGDFTVDQAVIAIGVRPETSLAAACGLQIGPTGGIVVDEKMRTSDPNILAAGDCAELRHLISQKPVLLPLGSLANREGRVIGSNLGGGDERFGPVVGSAAVKVFDLNVAATGLTRRAAEEAGFAVGEAWGSFTDKADYFPGAENLYLKLVYDRKTTQLLGLQALSQGEAVKRVDVFAAFLKRGGRLEDLLDAEFAYAPPFAPALDPLYSLAAAARNELLEGIRSLPPDSKLEGRFLIDIRRAKEAAERPLPEKTTNLPFEDFQATCSQVPKDGEVVCICSKGARSSEAARILKAKGCDVAYIAGGSLLRLGQQAPSADKKNQ